MGTLRAPRTLIFDDAHAIGLRESMNVTGSPRSRIVRISANESPTDPFVIVAPPFSS